MCLAALPAIPGLCPHRSRRYRLWPWLPAAYVQGYGDPTLMYAVQDLSLFVAVRLVGRIQTSP